MEIYFTADTHFFHKNLITYCDRPFSCVEEMNEKLISNWNDMISPSDTVYHLGDIAFCSGKRLEDILLQLNGNIIHIAGNHDDKKVLKVCRRHHTVVESSNLTIKYKEYNIFLSHMYMKHLNDNKNLLHFHGHEHGTDLMKSYGCLTYSEMRKRFSEEKYFGVKNNAIEVGVDLWNFKPVHIEQILEKLL